MKPLHIGLLVVGAALAGGLAVKMSQPVPVPATSPDEPALVSRVVPSVDPRVNPPSVTVPVTLPQSAPPAPIAPQPAKPSPLAAPETITEPAPHTTPVRKNEPRLAKTFAAPAPYQPPSTPSSQPGLRDVPPAVITPAPPPAPVSPRQVTLPAGTAITVRTGESLSSDRNAGGDTFIASLADPLVADGLVIAERGASVGGRVVNSQRAGRTGGSPVLELRLATISTADGQRVPIPTDSWNAHGDLPQQTIILFRLASPVTITERP